MRCAYVEVHKEVPACPGLQRSGNTTSNEGGPSSRRTHPSFSQTRSHSRHGTGQGCGTAQSNTHRTSVGCFTAEGQHTDTSAGHAAAGTAGTCPGAGALSRHTRKGSSLQTHLLHHCNHSYQLTCSRALVKAKPLTKGAPSPMRKVNQHVVLLSGLQTNLSLYGQQHRYEALTISVRLSCQSISKYHLLCFCLKYPFIFVP